MYDLYVGKKRLALKEVSKTGCAQHDTLSTAQDGSLAVAGYAEAVG